MCLHSDHYAYCHSFQIMNLSSVKGNANIRTVFSAVAVTQMWTLAPPQRRWESVWAEIRLIFIPIAPAYGAICPTIPHVSRLVFPCAVGNEGISRETIGLIVSRILFSPVICKWYICMQNWDWPVAINIPVMSDFIIAVLLCQQFAVKRDFVNVWCLVKRC